MNKYIMKDVITNPEDTRLKGAIGKFVFFSDNPTLCVEEANKGNGFNFLDSIDSEKDLPFSVVSENWACIILKKEEDND